MQTRSRASAGASFVPIMRLSAAATLAAALTVQDAAACSCGCGLFDVGAGSQLPTGEGGTVFLEYNYLDQDRNWHGSHRAPAEDNEDKEVVSHFVTAGLRYTFNRDWGVLVQVPYWSRDFTTEEDDLGKQSHSAIGDIRLNAVYTGFSEDMSTGVSAGVKLATGDFDFEGFDRDTSIGSGSTDLLLGLFHRGALTADGDWTYFVNVQWDRPFAYQDGYKPGEEVNAGIGVYYGGGALDIGAVRIAPVLQLIGTVRARDHGEEGHPDDTGYERLLLSPGLEIDADNVRLYADVAFPIYQRVNGNQLTAPAYFKVSLGFDF